MQLLVAGAGDLGSRVGALAAAAGHSTILWTRRARPADDDPLAARRIAADFRFPDTWPELSADWVLFSAAPTERTEAAYRETYLEPLRELRLRLPQARFAFCSSTAVYADSAGGWLDENGALDATNFNARVLLAAENLLGERDLRLRIAGIYGPGRDFLVRELQAGRAAYAPGQYGNRIHIEDAAAATWFLIAREQAGVFNLVDPNPALQREVLQFLADSLGRPLPLPLPPRSGNRRISGEKLASLGFLFQYPDYRVGYSALLKLSPELKILR